MNSGLSYVSAIGRHMIALAVSLCICLPLAQAYGTRVAGGSNGTRVVKSDGTLWSWGDNTYGEVGDGTHGSTLSVKTPKQIGIGGRSPAQRITRWR